MIAVQVKRFFQCRFCSHMMRFGSSHCGSCYQPAPVHNRVWFWWLVGLGLTLFVLWIVLLQLA